VSCLFFLCLVLATRLSHLIAFLVGVCGSGFCLCSLSLSFLRSCTTTCLSQEDLLLTSTTSSMDNSALRDDTSMVAKTRQGQDEIKKSQKRQDEITYKDIDTDKNKGKDTAGGSWPKLLGSRNLMAYSTIRTSSMFPKIRYDDEVKIYKEVFLFCFLVLSCLRFWF
jgi:hypothetical protein